MQCGFVSLSKAGGFWCIRSRISVQYPAKEKGKPGETLGRKGAGPRQTSRCEGWGTGEGVGPGKIAALPMAGGAALFVCGQQPRR